MQNPIPHLTFFTTRGKLEYSPRVSKATSSPLPAFLLFTKQRRGDKCILCANLKVVTQIKVHANLLMDTSSTCYPMTFTQVLRIHGLELVVNTHVVRYCDDHTHPYFQFCSMHFYPQVSLYEPLQLQKAPTHMMQNIKQLHHFILGQISRFSWGRDLQVSFIIVVCANNSTCTP